jgi:hypothetical protein
MARIDEPRKCVSDGDEHKAQLVTRVMDDSGFADARSQATMPHVTASRIHERKASDTCKNASAPWCAVSSRRESGWI